jgi:hypothetical protein
MKKIYKKTNGSRISIPTRINLRTYFEGSC